MRQGSRGRDRCAAEAAHREHPDEHGPEKQLRHDESRDRACRYPTMVPVAPRDGKEQGQEWGKSSQSERREQGKR
jgi:hypothetical protein